MNNLLRFLLPADRVLELDRTRWDKSPNANPIHQLFILVLQQAINDKASCVHFSPGPDDGELKLSYCVPDNPDLIADEAATQSTMIPMQSPLPCHEDPSADHSIGVIPSHPSSRWFEMRPLPAELCESAASTLRLLAGIPKSQQTGTLWIRHAGRVRRLPTVTSGHDVFVFTGDA